MPTHAELATKLLTEAAQFFQNLGEQNESVTEQMDENAKVFLQMAQLLQESPEGVIQDQTHGQLGGKLLKDAASFFRTIGEQNEPIKEQMLQNAEIYDQIGDLVASNPLGQAE